MNPYVGYTNIVPLLAPVDIASTVTASSYMSLKNAQRAAFLVYVGLLTSATTTNTEDITVEAATAEGGTEAAIDFWYRVGSAVGANTWGAITSASVLALSSDTQDGVMVWLEFDVDALAANDYQVVRVKFTDNDDMTAALVSVIGFIDPRYRMTTHRSATASASS
jgi:hypothetical protein